MISQFETLTYNGFSFPVESKLEIEFDPKYDRADRTVVGVTHMLNVTVTLKTDTLAGMTVGGFVLTGTNETDLPAIKSVLTRSGQRLVLTGTGFGDLSVNGDVQKQDSAWGPKPRRCHFLPLGTTACVLRWSCEVQLPTCLDATFTGRYMAYNYSVSTSVDEQGYCTRTITGYFEVPATRQANGGNVVGAGALTFWNAGTTLPVPAGFRRTQNQATESDDRRRVDFTVVDTETNDIILPPNVVECKASHSVQTADKAAKRMVATLRASYTLRKGVPKQDAFTYFLIMLFNKWTYQTTGGITGVNRQSIVPVSLTIEDPDIYGRQAGNFSMTWTYVNGAIDRADATDFDGSTVNLVPNSALWAPGVKRAGGTVQDPQGNSWSLWAQSMNTVFGTNYPRFAYREGDDIILDLCGQGLVPKTRGTFFRVADYGLFKGEVGVKVNAKTFLKYETSLFVWTVDGKIFKPAPVKKLLAGAQSVISAWFGEGAGRYMIGDVQYIGGSRVFAILRYDILQAAVPPATPILSSVGGEAAVFAKEGRREGKLHAVMFGVPVYSLPNYYLADGTALKNNNNFSGFGL